MEKISKEKYAELINGGQVFERTGDIPKVVRLSDGRFLKQFRIKKKLSFKRIIPETKYFVRHCKLLKKRGIPTVSKITVLKIPHLKQTAVLYSPLEGRTVREIASVGELDSKVLHQLGSFVANLHQKGVYFRSLHCGNIVLCPDNKFGLIDIADMRTLPWRLSPGICIRNFHHIFRYDNDLKIINEVGIKHFINGYLRQRSNKDAVCKRLTETLENEYPIYEG